MRETSYVLITPVRNEEATIEITIRSVLAQTILPEEWVIVSDSSTDTTDQIIAHYTAVCPFIRFRRLEDRATRSFSSVVFATNAGYQSLQCRPYHFLGLLDADVRFPADYYERLIGKFAADPQLGLAGGWVCDQIDGKLLKEAQNFNEVAGATQFFRRACFEASGALLPIAEGGWDAITAVQARMHGYRTATFPELIMEHLKPRNASIGNWFQRHWQFGVRDHVLGYHPLFELAKCVTRLPHQPMILGALARWCGFAWSAARHNQQVPPPEVIQYMRREQVQRLAPRCLKPFVLR